MTREVQFSLVGPAVWINGSGTARGMDSCGVLGRASAATLDIRQVPARLLNEAVNLPVQGLMTQSADRLWRAARHVEGEDVWTTLGRYRRAQPQEDPREGLYLGLCLSARNVDFDVPRALALLDDATGRIDDQLQRAPHAALRECLIHSIGPHWMTVLRQEMTAGRIATLRSKRYGAPTIAVQSAESRLHRTEAIRIFEYATQGAGSVALFTNIFLTPDPRVEERLRIHMQAVSWDHRVELALPPTEPAGPADGPDGPSAAPGPASAYQQSVLPGTTVRAPGAAAPAIWTPDPGPSEPAVSVILQKLAELQGISSASGTGVTALASALDQVREDADNILQRLLAALLLQFVVLLVVLVGFISLHHTLQGLQSRQGQESPAADAIVSPDEVLAARAQLCRAALPGDRRAEPATDLPASDARQLAACLEQGGDAVLPPAAAAGRDAAP